MLVLLRMGGPFAPRDYTYNSLDLPTNMVSGISGIGNVTDDYSHDPLDQLVRARYPPPRRTPRRASAWGSWKRPARRSGPTSDAQGRMVSAATAPHAVSFIYDGRNRCVARTTVRGGRGD